MEETQQELLFAPKSSSDTVCVDQIQLDSLFSKLDDLRKLIDTLTHDFSIIIKGSQSSSNEEIATIIKATTSQYSDKIKGLVECMRLVIDKAKSIFIIPVDGIPLGQFSIWNTFDKIASGASLAAKAFPALSLACELCRLCEDIYLYHRYAYSLEECPLLFYSHRTAKHMGLTWVGYFERINTLVCATKRNGPMFFASFIVEILSSRKQGSVCETFTTDETDGIAFADYAYCEYDSSKDGRYIDVCSLDDCPIPTYDKVSGIFELERGLRGSITIRDSSIDVAFSGTRLRNVSNWITNLVQYFSMADSVYLASAGIVEHLLNTYQTRDINVYGHSLGGGLSQFALSVLNDNYKKRLKAFCYNSAGLSKGTCRLKGSCSYDNITHIVVDKDIVSRIGKLRGKVKIIKPKLNEIRVHNREYINKKLHKNTDKVYCKIINKQ